MGDDEVFSISLTTGSLDALSDELDVLKHAPEMEGLVRTVSEDRRCRFSSVMTSWQERDSSYELVHNSAPVDDEVWAPPSPLPFAT